MIAYDLSTAGRRRLLVLRVVCWLLIAAAIVGVFEAAAWLGGDIGRHLAAVAS